MNPKTKQTWISIAIATVIVCVIAGLAVLGGSVLWIRKHFNTQFTSAEIAGNELERERARFAGQQPLIEWQDERDPPRIHRRTVANTGDLQALRVLAFDPGAGKLVRVSIPFWLLRLTPSKHFRFFDHESGVAIDADRLDLTVEDLERAGPGLVLDAHSRRDGARVLVWSE
jgi:hypothetical protein